MFFAGALNVRRLTGESLNAYVLPKLLPAACFKQDCVPWGEAGGPPLVPRPRLLPAAPASATPAAAGPGPAATEGASPQPARPAVVGIVDGGCRVSAAWLAQLWAWLAERGDVLAVCDWPLLPIQGSRLCLLRARSQVLREGEAWQEEVRRRAWVCVCVRVCACPSVRTRENVCVCVCL